jgi:magnesium-transporting ATPase (P-type)
MDTLIGIGTLTAFTYSSLVFLLPPIRELLKAPEYTYFDVTIVVIGFVTLGKYLEARSKIKTGEAIEKLLNLQAKTAIVIKNGKEMEISISEVVVGDVLVVKPGQKVPVDGIIYSYWDKRWKKSFMFYVSFASASIEFINWVQEEIYSSLKITGHVTSAKGHSTHQLKYAKSDSINFLRAMYYRDNILCLRRKRLKVCKILDIVKTLK